MIFQQYYIIIHNMQHIYLYFLLIILTQSAIYDRELIPDDFWPPSLFQTQSSFFQNYENQENPFISSLNSGNQGLIEGQDAFNKQIQQAYQEYQEELNRKLQLIKESFPTEEGHSGWNQDTKNGMKLLINPSQFVYKQFSAYLKQFNKSYQTLQQYYYRQFIYYQNLQKINVFNQNPDRLFNMGLNEFTDYEPSEFTNIFAALIPYDITQIHFSRNRFLQSQKQQRPNTTVNWKCYAGSIANQGRCGSCYAFSTADAVAALYAIYDPLTLNNVRLSVQQLISCNDPILQDGCKGGRFEHTYDYIIKYGITTQINYPYSSAFSSEPPACNQKKKNAKNKRIISEYKHLEPSCNAVIESLKNQPLAVGISSKNLQFYSEGVFEGQASFVDHAVLVVGYDPNLGFQIKNMWGLTWGRLGFGWVDYEKNAGICSIAMSISMKDQSSFKRKQCETAP